MSKSLKVNNKRLTNDHKRIKVFIYFTVMLCILFASPEISRGNDYQFRNDILQILIKATADQYLKEIVPQISTAVIRKAYMKDERMVKVYTRLSAEFELIHTIQMGSFLRSADAKKQFNSIVQKLNYKGLDYLRIEKIGDYYCVRIGKFEDRVTAEEYLKERDFQIIRPLITKAYMKDERIEAMYAGAPLLEEKPLFADTEPEEREPSADEKPGDTMEANNYAAVSPSDDDRNVEDEVRTDTEPEENRLSDSEKPLTETKTEHYAAHVEEGDDTDASHQGDLIEKPDHETALMDDHELWEELDLEHVEEDEAIEYHFSEIEPIPIMTI
jgi:hypothetical protein